MNYSIFIVDDEPPSLRNLKRKVIETGLNFEVIGEAYNGEVALSRIQSSPHPPDVILTDIQMPVMDGLTLLQNINQVYPNIHKILVSGYKEFDYAKKAIEIRAYNYLLKPIHIEVLRESLTAIQYELEYNQYDEMKTKLQSHLRHKQILKTDFCPIYLQTTYHIIAMHIEYTLETDIEYYGEPYWNADLITEYLNSGLGDPLSFWVLECDKPYEFIIVVSDRIPISELERAWQAIQRKASADHTSITLAIQKKVDSLGYISFYAQQLFSFLHRQLIIGKPQTLYKENRLEGSANQSLGTNAVQKIRQYIQDYYYEPLDMKELSLEHGISATYLSTIFKRKLGMTPMEYVINVRMEHAKKLIKQDPKLLIKDIAEMVGYADNHYFSRVFKEFTGYNPSEFR